MFYSLPVNKCSERVISVATYIEYNNIWEDNSARKKVYFGL